MGGTGKSLEHLESDSDEESTESSMDIDQSKMSAASSSQVCDDDDDDDAGICGFNAVANTFVSRSLDGSTVRRHLPPTLHKQNDQNLSTYIRSAQGTACDGGARIGGAALVEGYVKQVGRSFIFGDHAISTQVAEELAYSLGSCSLTLALAMQLSDAPGKVYLTDLAVGTQRSMSYVLKLTNGPRAELDPLRSLVIISTRVEQVTCREDSELAMCGQCAKKWATHGLNRDQPAYWCATCADGDGNEDGDVKVLNLQPMMSGTLTDGKRVPMLVPQDAAPGHICMLPVARVSTPTVAKVEGHLTEIDDAAWAAMRSGTTNLAKMMLDSKASTRKMHTCCLCHYKPHGKCERCSEVIALSQQQRMDRGGGSPFACVYLVLQADQ